MATHRLCDAAIAFTIAVLEAFRKDSSIKDNNENKEKVDSVVTKLSGCYGKGPKGFADVGEEVGKLQVQVTGTNTSAINKLVSAVKTNYESHLKSLNGRGNDIYKNVGQYLDAVFKAVSGKADVTSPLNTLFSRANPVYDATTLSAQIVDLKNGLDTQKASKGFAKNVLDAGKNAFMDVLKMPNYTRMNYEAASSKQWNSETEKVKTCAKIFLGCLPLYYQAFTYIYWGCHDNGGGWGSQTLAHGDLRSYFDSQGLLPIFVDRNKRGSHIAESALKKFSEFKTAADSSLTDSNIPYVKFTQKLQDKVRENSGNVSTECPLSALFHGASYYFRCQQMTNAKSAGGTPKTIREMLYFLAALQFSSAYDEINGHIGTLLTTELSVADSGLSTADNTLSAADIKEYLTASCAFSSSVLGLIQGPGASEKDSEPWLFELFCNSAFQFKYPSGAALLSKVSRYAYALQFQLYFLFHQCSIDINKCGWNNCTYGSEIKGSDTQLSSHVCPGLKCNGDSNCNHYSKQSCKHNNYSQNNSCGKGSNPSALQAFITGTLPSFGLSSSSTP